MNFFFMSQLARSLHSLYFQSFPSQLVFRHLWKSISKSKTQDVKNNTIYICYFYSQIS